MSGHGYRYVGDGERWRGVPARDLTQEEYEQLGPLEQRTVREGGGYSEITADEAKRAAKEAEAEAKRLAEEAAKQEAEAQAAAQEGTE